MELRLASLASAVGSSVKGNIVAASAPPSVNVPSLRVERPPSPPALRITSAVPKDRTGGVSSVIPTRYSPTDISNVSLGDSGKLTIAGQKLRTKWDNWDKSNFFSGTTKEA